MKSCYSTAEVAARAGVHRDTLLRWLRQRKVPEPSRNAKGWRVFSADDISSIQKFAEGQKVGDDFDEASNFRNRFGAIYDLDWSFLDARTDYLTHGLHPYPAKFIPQIPNALIQELSSVGDTVLDLFCGSGTTLVEARALKRHAIGIDANPLACLISRAKTQIAGREDLHALRELATRASDLASRTAAPTPDLFSDLPFTSLSTKPDTPDIGFWFEPFVIEELSEIREWCNQLHSPTARDLAHTAFSSIVVAVSKQDSDTRYVRRQKSIQPGSAFARFSRAIERAVVAAAEAADLFESRFGSRVLCENAIGSQDIGTVDLVVTSPPYPNAYSYHLYHRTRMLWLGFDQVRFKGAEIGSHRKYSSKGKNAATVDTFKREMSLIFQWVRERLKIGKYACFVIGDSKVRGEVIDNAALLAAVGAQHGFVEVARIERPVNGNRKYFNQKIGRIKSEHVLILSNKG